MANERSLAWAVAKGLASEGARVALSHLDERLGRRVGPLARELGAEFTLELDVSRDDHLERLGGTVRERWGGVDVLVHSLAFARREDLAADFSETPREGFRIACDVSAFSLVGVCAALKGLMGEGASVMAMTYQGSARVVDGYNVMGAAKAALEASVRYLASDLGRGGVRVNCISAGPVRTLSASAVPGLRRIFKAVEERAPLRRNISPGDVAGAAVFLAGGLSAGVTGQVLHVDGGFSIMGA